MTEELTLQDLVTRSGMNLRTIRYYMQEGILQGPDTRGKYAHYSQLHLDRLELIQRLKNMYLPLQEIRHIIETLTPEEISQVKNYQDMLNPIVEDRSAKNRSIVADEEVGKSALEYIHNLQQAQTGFRTAAPKPAQPSMPPSPTVNSDKVAQGKTSSNMSNSAEEWSRVILADGIELHIRRKVSSGTENRIENLIRYAKKLFGTKT
jgi:DNA-binding transcriptional MerR regulator